MLRKYGTKEHSNGLFAVAMTWVKQMGLISFIHVYKMILIHLIDVHARTGMF